MDNLKLEETYISTNGIRLHTVIAGPQSGPPVVLLHGFPETWRCWIRQLPALVNAGCRVIVPDQRGYNLSDKPKGVKNYRISTLVDDIVGLIEALEYEKVNLVGHDWGAAVAWMLANKYPNRLQRLGIMNVPHPAVMRRFLMRDLEQIRRSWYVFFFQLPWLPEAGMRRDNWRGAEYALRGSGKIHTFTKEDIETYKEAWSQPGAMTAMINWYRAALQYQSPVPKDPCIKVPTLMMWGMKDFALSHRMARPSMDYVKDGNLIIFPEATHWVQRDESEEVNHYLLDFLLDKISVQVVR
jgi:Predicted hydrolases or acyltransferases (alpha/beta hydrolase superfamily)